MPFSQKSKADLGPNSITVFESMADEASPHHNQQGKITDILQMGEASRYNLQVTFRDQIRHFNAIGAFLRD